MPNLPLARMRANDPNLRLSIAPMMKYTDTHCRYFHRLLSPSSRLYTEMVTTPAILHGNKKQLMAFNTEEHPIALQLGSNDPKQLAECAVIAEQLGFDEVNLNCGCPSNRVQDGHFGACLMLTPQLVADSVTAMREKTTIPITVKSRIGVDDNDSYDELMSFASAVINAGCDTLIIHARKAYLQGLNPKQNRTIPPLKYDWVYQLKQRFTNTPIVINGGIETAKAITEHLKHVDGVMIGRQAYHHPRSLIAFEQKLFNTNLPTENSIPLIDLLAIYEQYMQYAYSVLANGHPKLRFIGMVKHAINLFEGYSGSRLFKRINSENAYKINNANDAKTLTKQALQPIIEKNF